MSAPIATSKSPNTPWLVLKTSRRWSPDSIQQPTPAFFVICRSPVNDFDLHWPARDLAESRRKRFSRNVRTYHCSAFVHTNPRPIFFLIAGNRARRVTYVIRRSGAGVLILRKSSDAKLIEHQRSQSRHLHDEQQIRNRALRTEANHPNADCQFDRGQ